MRKKSILFILSAISLIIISSSCTTQHHCSAYSLKDSISKDVKTVDAVKINDAANINTEKI